MTFSKVYGALLLPFVGNYRKAKNEKGRNQVLKNAADAVTKSGNLLEDGVDLPKDVISVRFFRHSAISTIAYLIRPSLAILRPRLRRNRLKRKGTRNRKNLNKFIQSAMLSYRIIELLSRKKFRTSHRTKITLEVINVRLPQFIKT